MKTKLQEVLEKHHGRLRRVVATCKGCEKMLYDVPHRHDPPIHAPSYIAAEIEVRMAKHQEETGHDNLDIYLDTQKVVEEIDCDVTVTVNSE